MSALIFPKGMKSMMKLPVYMDNHATTPLDPKVLEAMMPCLTTEFGNAASRTHCFGWQAESKVNTARDEIARFIHATPEEIVFTSGATESNNVALKGAVGIYKEKGNHIITQVTEHKSVLDTCKYLETQGVKITYLPVNSQGLIDLGQLEAAITDQTLLISIMYANNEIGTLQPVAEIGKIAKARNILFHVDGAQAAGKVPLDVDAMGIDILSLSAHKIYGPKGIGVLYVRKKNPRVRLTPLIHGGGHEGGFRSGTLNVPGIVGFGKACEIARKEMDEESKRMAKLRDRLQASFQMRLAGVHINGNSEYRLPNNLSVSFDGVDGEAVLMSLDGKVAVSTGSACNSANTEPSYVLKAIGLSPEKIRGSIRFGLGRFTTDEEIVYVADRVVEVVTRLRQLSPFAESNSA